MPGAHQTPESVTPIILDLRHGATLPALLLRRLDEVEVRDFSVFNELIARLGQGREHDIDWCVCRPATRNNHISELYGQCMQLALLRDLLEDGHHVVVQTDAPELAAVLRRAAPDRLTVAFSRGWKTRLRRISQILSGIAATLFHCTAAALAARLTRNDSAAPDAPLSVINTFVSRAVAANGEFTDRYFPGLTASLSEEERANCRYLPVFHRVRNYPATFRTLRRASIQFLFYEDYLNFADYAFAFGHWWRSRKLIGVTTHYAGFEIGPLVDADIRGGRFASIVVRALLTYRFYQGAARRGLRIRSVLDWYEGLDYNHAIAAAINWHCPKTSLTGFRSAGSLYYTSCTPAPHEVTTGVVPHRLAVVGTGLAREIQILCPKLNVIDAPGMRYQSLASLHRQAVEGRAILLALPLSAPLARDCILTMAAARAQMSDPPRHWWVKSHPALPEREVLALLGGALPDGMEFVQGDFYKWLVRADLVAGAASSTLMESVAMGIPAICLAVGNVPTEIPVPAEVDENLSRVAYAPDEIATAIAQMIQTRISAEERARLHETMLGAVDDAMKRRLLELD